MIAEAHMRHRVLVLVLIASVSGALYAADVPVTLKKTGDCAGTATLFARDSGDPIASCGAGCTEVTVSVPAGTWLRLDSRGWAGCSKAGAVVDGPTFIQPAPRIGRHPAGNAFQVGAEGNVVTTRFTYSPPRLPMYIPPGNSVK
jgi:hypothetical protein